MTLGLYGLRKHLIKNDTVVSSRNIILASPDASEDTLLTLTYIGVSTQGDMVLLHAKKNAKTSVQLCRSTVSIMYVSEMSCHIWLFTVPHLS